ncbi:NAD(P)H-dependent oxidoreductase [Phaeobacter gallaeciensis]|uniref:NAD(P)H dehydrogenase (Quinone) n=1 Tax=Phaeobacter gallaeciensis TaxID=60890 RepID=A0AAD0EBB7_9RHOB|nr:NAD(P)H-dependent oxidoreductase [Phaeobacter gallaeciensis]AHD07816.1 Putative NADPH-quinone reductase (modulator of drug activity B) [Phaeobacter gallaeciensis DSM 26640]ATE91084.1 putative NAD(P)H dehydrogenase (quinone) [Phaeobacter gallaeciensis]ATE95359.1 putative NAD(P)H dehydrogenase (quinone) [Phaeobacter gallaeciensis]ATE99698.1 putative NAD(P)H dehydrogenase (quinone) [Phaeobacter gallaeciensis]ATF04131.1 putative NAD(P)H dehydrogenase (quinone) [Phaeobacter gallaeciensis]
MSTRKIIILNGHPAPSSLSQSLCQTYQTAAEAGGHQVRYHDLPTMQFDIDYGQAGYQNVKPLEPDLADFLTDLEWADHIVMATPMWWGAIPAKLKGVFDRALLPGRAFDTRNVNVMGLPAPMLTGKTARVLLTSDTPALWLRLIYGNAIKRIISSQILGFVGIKPTRFSSFAPATDAAEKTVFSWQRKVADLGARAA